MIVEPSPVDTTNPNNYHKEKMIDYTNLYIKNLDSQVTSYDLFQKFKDFGKIISARVMKDTQTGISKGYGFVSFTLMEDANLAMQKMQGEKLYNKGIIITFHEPKKSIVQNKNNPMEFVPQQPYPYIYSTSPPPPPMYNVPTVTYPQFVPEHVMSFKQPPMNDVNGWIPPPLSSSGQTNKNTLAPPPYAYSSPMHPTSTNNAFESNHFIVSPSNAPVPPPGYSHHLERTRSDAPNTLQRQKLREAISVHFKSNNDNDLEDIVEMIQSLKKRDLSLCLFNPTFLKQKITEAYNALYTFEEERRKSVSIATTPSLHHLDESDDDNSIASLLASLEGMSLNKKKKVFGDILFPHVKATGVRRAPKVTIWLLDSVPLDELAAIMFDQHELSRMANYATTQI